MCRFLKYKVVRLLKAQRLQIRKASKLHHGRRTAHQNLGRSIARRRRHMLLHHLLRNKPGRMLPSLRGAIHRVMQPEPTPVLLHRLLQLPSDENIILRLIRVQQRYRDVGPGLVAEDGVHYLEHGGDARASRDHAEVLGRSLLVCISFEDGVDGEASIFAIRHVTLGTSHIHRIADLERIQMLTHLPPIGKLGMHPRLVHFDHERDRARRIIPCRRSVTPLVVLRRTIL
mmetsp:Transcript_9580/g.17288  ORF Transcript_9580/g.17288 Transcript_9580/m.17288 type:complete len:229 (-) Transcript_9580:353-1039(-)